MVANATRVHRIAVLAGEGIGPEIIVQAIKVLEALRDHGLRFELFHAPVGGPAIEACGEPLPPATLKLVLSCDAVLFGAVGNPAFDHLDANKRPERAILGLRRQLGLFAGLKHIAIPAALAHLSPLKAEVVAGTDLLLVRELDGDVYTGQPKGERLSPDGAFEGQREGHDTMRYAEGEVERIAHPAFQAALGRSRRVCSVDKANVLATSRLWREVVTRVSIQYPEVTLTHMYADNAAMQLITRPTAFDVLLTGNLFGDILSDAASVLTGSMGLPASALLGRGPGGMFEAGHGTAWDIAGQDLACPLACIRAAGLMLRHALDRPDLADRVERAVVTVLEQGGRTQDLRGALPALGTQAMGDAVVKVLHAR